jgi:hypothetical protein
MNPAGSFRQRGGRHVAEAVSPQARRLTTPRWLDTRLVLGVLLVLFAVVAGARVFAAADHYSRVYVARHDLVPGERLSADDLAVGRVRLASDSSFYIGAGSAPVGYVVSRFVGAHELVPAAALASGPAAPDSRLVTVPVQPGHLPPALGRGSVVDVYLTPKAGAGVATPTPVLVLASAPVQSRDGGARGFGGESTLSVVLAVPADHVADLVRAVESGTIDLVAVPPAAVATATGQAAGPP